MNRKDFFKKLGITLGAIAIAPQLLAEINIPQEGFVKVSKTTFHCEGLIPFLQREGKRKYYTSAYSLADFDEIIEMLKSQKIMMDNVWNIPL